MTQELICWNREGIAMVSDSLIVAEEEGQRRFLTQQKLFPLGSHAAIVSAGAAVGIDLCQDLQRQVEARRLQYWLPIRNLAISFLETGYSRFLAEARPWFEAHPDAYRRLYFCLAGYDLQDMAHPCQICLLQSEELELPFRQLRVAGPVLTIPRQLTVEAALMQKLRGGASLRNLAESGVRYLEQLAQRLPESIGGPFYAALITEDGFTFLENSQ